MNIRNHSRWGVALAALVLVLTAACGTEAAVAPADFGGADRDTPTETRPDDNPARLDFGDNGLG